MAEYQQLLEQGQLWRGNSAPHRRKESLSSGFELLDHALNGGWEQGCLTELLSAQHGIGELRLLLPALSDLSLKDAWHCWVNPPFIPYAPSLSHSDICLDKLLWLSPEQSMDALWATEQALKSGCCSAVLAWLEDKDTYLESAQLRRLHLAAEAGNSVCWLFRPSDRIDNASPAPYRLELIKPAQENTLQIEVHKRRGGWPISPFCIELNDCEFYDQPLKHGVSQTAQLLQGPW